MRAKADMTSDLIFSARGPRPTRLFISSLEWFKRGWSAYGAFSEDRPKAEWFTDVGHHALKSYNVSGFASFWPVVFLIYPIAPGVMTFVFNVSCEGIEKLCNRQNYPGPDATLPQEKAPRRQGAASFPFVLAWAANPVEPSKRLQNNGAIIL